MIRDYVEAIDCVTCEEEEEESEEEESEEEEKNNNGKSFCLQSNNLFFVKKFVKLIKTMS